MVFELLEIFLSLLLMDFDTLEIPKNIWKYALDCRSSWTWAMESLWQKDKDLGFVWRGCFLSLSWPQKPTSILLSCCAQYYFWWWSFMLMISIL
jgi:hypothetical protein